MFRSFQGWLALSPQAPGSGTLKVLPCVKEATAYILLRPFLPDVPAADFCGAIPGKGQDLMRKWHGELFDSLVPVPAMEAGDMVFWHSDLVHAVEQEHNGSHDSAVFYIPSLPHTEVNRRYVERQARHFLEGRTPPDFPPNDSERFFSGRGGPADLTEQGRRMLGLPARRRGGIGHRGPAAVRRFRGAMEVELNILR